jgi:hypothetical protein
MRPVSVLTGDSSQANVPVSPPQSESESVTPRSQPYPDTPPVLDADIFDPVPFSVRITEKRTPFGPGLIISSLQASFSAFLNLSTRDDALRSPADMADMAPDPVQDVKRLSSQPEVSYYVEVCALCSGHSEN